MDIKTSALANTMSAALSSRDARSIRRRLPEPISSPSSSSMAAGPPQSLVDFNSNDYLSLSTSDTLRKRFLTRLSESPYVLGSGGSRLLVNGGAHDALEKRLARFFCSASERKTMTALLFNSGFDANAGLFASVPQAGDALVHDEYIHASVHDGMRASRVASSRRLAFAHNSIADLRRVLNALIEEDAVIRAGAASVFVAVESLYSMDGTFAPLVEMVETLEELLPKGNGYLIVDEAHATGLYGPKGRGRVAQLGLEGRVFARLHTFGKALAGTGAVLVVPTLVRDFLLNYARPLIYTTSLSYPNVIAADCAFDMLEDGTAQRLSDNLQSLSAYLTATLRALLLSHAIPTSLLRLPDHLASESASAAMFSYSFPGSSMSIASNDSHSSLTSIIPQAPIIPILTPHPRSLSAYLLARGMNARPITWPTVPKGADRVRVCLHAGNTKTEVDALIWGVLNWTRELVAEEKKKLGKLKKRTQPNEVLQVDGLEQGLLESKL